MVNETLARRNIQLISTLQIFSQSYIRVSKNRVNCNKSNKSSFEINLQYNCLDVWNEINSLVNVPENFDYKDKRYSEVFSKKLKLMNIDKKDFFDAIIYLYGSNSIDTLSFFIYKLINL